MGFPSSSVSKESVCNTGHLGSVPGSGRSPGEGNGNPLQHSCLENPVDRGAWWATVPVVPRVGQDLTTKAPPICVYFPYLEGSSRAKAMNVLKAEFAQVCQSVTLESLKLKYQFVFSAGSS